MSTMNDVIYPPDETVIDLQLMQEKLNIMQRVAKWNSCKSIMAPLVRSLSEIGIEACFGNDLDVVFTGDKAKLILVMRAVRVAGFHFTETKRPQKGQSNWSSWCVHPNCAQKLWFNFNSSVCKQVPTGKTRTVEIPIYEVQCGEDLGEETLALGDATAGISDPPLIDEIPF